MIFGLIGLAMARLGFPIAPVIIGVVLGTQAEFNLRVSLLMSYGDTSILYTRPICIILILLSLVILLYPLVGYWRHGNRASSEAQAVSHRSRAVSRFDLGRVCQFCGGRRCSLSVCYGADSGLTAFRLADHEGGHHFMASRKTLWPRLSASISSRIFFLGSVVLVWGR